jgi:lipopolysaccharide transport system ATP-binding protein
MSNIVIKVDNLSKQYRLGKIGTGSFTHDVNRLWHKVLGKEDPYLKIGETNDRTRKGNSDYVWSLQDINFEIKQGEAVGIIGRNGAGKSTLLKILSRTTMPTTGRIKIKGKVASLLEVGTGFHPELTGRENIFLNGAILGMTKADIKRKFDEIVDFSGVERYIDTPVKRYSSGMYVRLAFGVAAHLEPEILIVDEVLAVGDAEFQRKCLGKMQDVTGHGRTVLFVSHNMSAVENLCSRCIFLKNGRLVMDGQTENVIETYIASNHRNINLDDINDRQGNGLARITNIELLRGDQVPSKDFMIGEDIVLKVHYNNNAGGNRIPNIVLSIYNEKDVLVANVSNAYSGAVLNDGLVTCTIKNNMFNRGTYYFNIALFHGGIGNSIILDKIENFEAFNIIGGDPYKTGNLPNAGVIILSPNWR